MHLSRFYKKPLNAMRFLLAKIKYDFSQNDTVVSSFAFSELDYLVLVKWDGKLGDTEVVSGFLKILKDKLPELNIIVICPKAVKSLYQDYCQIDQVIESPKRPDSKTIRKIITQIGPIGSNGLLVSTEVFCRPRDLQLFYALKPRYIAGFDDRLHSVNINLIKRNPNSHLVQYFSDLLTLGQLTDFDYSYVRFFATTQPEKLSTLFAGEKKYIGLVPYGAAKSKRLSNKVIMQIYDFLIRNTDFTIVPFIMNKEVKARSELLCRIDPRRTVFLPEMTVEELAAATAKLSALISVDTANIHLATACHIPILGFYNDNAPEVIRWSPGPCAHKLSSYLVVNGKNISAINYNDIKESVEAFVRSIL
ncbi:MAG: glycosyltransferase family 9 protein [Succinivibrio sp.]|nr:glycosyltransferase family 9 protein [Succinivibrio sp.]